MTEVRFSKNKVYSQEKLTDLLVALNEETIHLHKENLKENSAILYDGERIKVTPEEFTAKKIQLLSLPLTTLVKEAGISPVMQNNIALGASCGLLNFSRDVLFSVIQDIFKRKGEQVIEENKKAATIGYDYAVKNFKDKFIRLIEQGQKKDQLVITGNEAIALGAISAGCKFYAAYPMTPSSSILHYLASKATHSGMVVKHAEDEISVINMAIGASYAGVRSMVGTSGGGFSLMVEGLGLAAITEVPLVIVLGQRPGPATGMPTWTGQADLQFAIHAAQDEFPRIVLAPGDQEEAFYLTKEAFNLADMYQIPVFVLSDKYVSENHMAVNQFKPESIPIERGKLITTPKFTDLTNYLRYKDSDDGISPRVIPGVAGTHYLANSYEHDEYGFSSEDAKERVAQVNRRNRKLETYMKNIPKPKVYGEQIADLTLVGWGSTKAPVLQALQDINYMMSGKRINFLHLTHVWPLNTYEIIKVLNDSKQRIMIEGNSTAQMTHLIREYTGETMDDILLKYDGRPFYPEEIIQKLHTI